MDEPRHNSLRTGQLNKRYPAKFIVVFIAFSAFYNGIVLGQQQVVRPPIQLQPQRIPQRALNHGNNVVQQPTLNDQSVPSGGQVIITNQSEFPNNQAIYPTTSTNRVLLPSGAALYRLETQKLTASPTRVQSWNHPSSMVKFYWDATAIKGCGAVIWQVSMEDPNSIGLTNHSSALEALQFNGIVAFGINRQTTSHQNKGQFHFNFKKYGHLIKDPLAQSFYIQIIPVNNSKERKPVGQPSAAIQILPPYETMVFNENWGTGSDQHKFKIMQLTSKLNAAEQLEKKRHENNHQDGSGQGTIDKIAGSSNDDDDN